MKSHAVATLFAAVCAGLVSCGAPEGATHTTTSTDTANSPGEDFFASCSIAPEPTPPAQCVGPDGSGWRNLPRPADAGPCPPPPEGDCEQVVLGRLPDISRYIDCPGYIVLHRSDWSVEVNDSLIACVAACRIGTCPSTAIVVSPRESIPDFDSDYRQTSVTSRELCQLHGQGCSVTTMTVDGPGTIDCGCER